MDSDDPASDILTDLYAGTLDDSPWNLAMVKVSDLVGAAGANLISLNLATGAVLRDESHRIDPAVSVAYREYWSTRDIFLGPVLKSPVGEPLPDYRLVPLDDWKRSALFNELALPAGLPNIMPTLLHRSADHLVALSLKASTRHGPFQIDEVRRLRTVIPHIRRALEIRDRLSLCQVRADNLAHSFSNLSFGVLILDGQGRVLEVSTVAQTLMSSKEGIGCARDGTLILRGLAGKTLACWIGSGKPPAETTDGLLKVPQSRGQPLSIMVTPLPHKTHSWIGADPRWLVLLFDPERRIRVSQPLIAQDLGISAREAEIAARLVAGEDLNEIAHGLSISLNTVRTHLKAIFSKTGIRSQVELIRRIADGPAAKG